MTDVRFTTYGGFTRIRSTTQMGRIWLRNHPDTLQWRGAVLQRHGAVDLEPQHATQIAHMMCKDGLLVTFTPKGTTDETEDHSSRPLSSSQRHLGLLR